MRWEDFRRSDNIEDRRGEGGGGFRVPGGAGGLGIGGLIVVGLISWATGIDPRLILAGAEMVTGGGSSYQERQAPPGRAGAPKDEIGQFVAAVLGSTEDVWNDIFRQRGQQYKAPRLVIYTQQTSTACGFGQAAMGPFYCPGDQKVYLDTSFFDELARRFRAPGEFAQAYVVAHEIGHHVQNLLGILPKVNEQRARLPKAEANALSVRVELQADCLAGVWGNYAQRRGALEPGDVEAALKAATAIGDDKLQREAQGRVVPDSFTHGTSAQRVKWFRIGLDTGDAQNCNTFSARSL